MTLADACWPEVPEGGLVLVPIGSTEQHGPHLPLDVDTVVAVAVARGLAPALGGLVAPAVAFGASGEHQDFPGTVSIGTPALTTVLVELGRSLTTWAGRVVLVNGHGGNHEAVSASVRQLQAEGRDVAWVPCAPDPCCGAGLDAHAGRVETSVMLHLDPARVRLALAEAGVTHPLAEVLPVLRAEGVREVAPNGVLGDPHGATSDEGTRLLDQMVARALQRLGAGVRS